jgi:hypothetical protein
MAPLSESALKRRGQLAAKTRAANKAKAGKKSASPVKRARRTTTRASAGTKKPRKPTGYNLYVKSEYAKIAKAHPSMMSSEIIAKVGPAWSKLTEAKKATWNNKAGKSRATAKPSKARAKATKSKRTTKKKASSSPLAITGRGVSLTKFIKADAAKRGVSPALVKKAKVAVKKAEKAVKAVKKASKSAAKKAKKAKSPKKLKKD